MNLISENSTVPSYDLLGNKGADLTVNNTALQLALAFKIGEYFSLAPSLGIVGMNLGDYVATPALNFGLGVLFMQNRLSVGAAMANMGGKLEFKEKNGKIAIGTGQPQPQLMRAGASVYLLRNKNLVLSYALQNTSNEKSASWNSFGLEWFPFRLLALRLGNRTIQNGASVPSAGIGFHYKRISLEVAQTISPSDYEGMGTTRFDLQFRFKNSERSAAVPAKEKKAVATAAPAQQPSMQQVVLQQPAAVPQEPYVPRASMEVSTVAVAEFTGKNVSQADASIVSDFLRTEMVNSNAFKLVEKANMDKLLAEAAFQQSGCSVADCAVKMGKILNVKFMLVGSLSKLLDTYYITVNVVSVETGEIMRSYSREAASARELRDGCKQLAIQIANER
ncbi:MAG: hypothetical protein A2293_08265 [Elusimicrobia bacterium RIFOXYB2_FULL_49_7]|nr:MAG: hypothetical protein A2293_08265 [Elusimicrobia bacterium RIFOXYB2_FULL_49_7]